MLIFSRKFRVSVVAVLLVAGLGLLLPLPAAAGQPDRGSEHGLFFAPAQAVSWLTGLWHDLSSLLRAGGSAANAGVTASDGTDTTNGTDEGPAIDPNGG